jgi:hypothetical protein
MSVEVWLCLISGIVGPLLFLAVYAASIRYPSLCEPYFIDLSRWLPVTTAAPGPLLPTKPSKIWRLGYVVGLLEGTSITNETAVAMAAEHLGADAADIDLMHVLNMGEALEQHEQRKTAWSKARSLLSVVNIMWVVSILGIALTIGPVVHLLFGHLLARLANLLIPYVIFVHHLARPFYNLPGYYLCLSVLLNAKRCSPFVAPYVALTGCALSITCLCFSLPSVAYERQGDLTTTAVDLFAFLTFALAAIDCTSSALGFLSVVALRCAAAATFEPLGAIFDGYDDLLVSMTSSAAIIALMLAWKCTPLMASSQDLFAPGVSVVGGIALGVQGLVQCASYYDDRFSVDVYIVSNLVFVVVCVALLVMGTVVDITALRCTSTVFLVLWVFLKCSEILDEDYQIVTAFLASLLAWRLSLFLKAHPEYFLALFTMFHSAARDAAPYIPLLRE